MDDSRIIELFWARDEKAVSEAEKKYGQYCYTIANNILLNHEDASECVNDMLLSAWNTIPPNRPEYLPGFLGSITRNLSLKKLRKKLAEKRGGGKQNLAMEELEECIPSEKSIDEQLEEKELVKIINSFLEIQKPEERKVFLRRYWFYDSVRDISSKYHYSESKVKSMLKRMRDRLRIRLQEEDIWV